MVEYLRVFRHVGFLRPNRADGHLFPQEPTTLTTPSHANAKDLVLKALSSSEQTGLSLAQVAAARDQFGWNELVTVAPEPAWKTFLAQFSDVVVWILIAAAEFNTV